MVDTFHKTFGPRTLIEDNSALSKATKVFGTSKPLLAFSCFEKPQDSRFEKAAQITRRYAKGMADIHRRDGATLVGG